MATARQPSFAGGEFTDTLWARTEFEKYGVGARRLRNMVVTKHGAASNRAGTYYGGTTRGDAWARILPFTFSNQDTLVLAFQPGIIRVYARGADGLPGAVLGVDGEPYKIETDYTEEQIRKLRYAQVGDVIRLTTVGHDMYELTRTKVAPLEFTWRQVGFDVPAFPAGIAVFALAPMPEEELPTYPAKQWDLYATAICEDQRGNVYETTARKVTEARYPAWNAGADYAPGDRVSCAGQNWEALPLDPQPGESPGTTRHVFHQGSPENGNWWSDDPMWSALGNVAMPAKFPIYPNKQVTLTQDGVQADPSFRIRAIRIYRGRGELRGYVGELYNGTFSDEGDAPDWSRTPPKGENPFKVFDWQDTLLRTERPAVGAYHAQRFVAARTDERSAFLFLSAINAYSNFDQHDPQLAEDAIILELASLTYEEIRGLISGRVLMVFGAEREWVVGYGQDGDQLSLLSAKPRTEFGSSWQEPVKVDDTTAFFFPTAGNIVRGLTFDGTSGTYDAPDLTLVSDHLFRGRQIVDRAWQRAPFPILWVVLDDGTLLSFTYVKEASIGAWSWHDTRGAVESVCCVREGAEDALWLVVRRTVNGQTRRYIERMATRGVTDAKEGLFLDAAVTYRGAPAWHFAGLDHLEGCTVNALADGNVVRGLVVQGGAIDLPADLFPDGAQVVHVGLPYVSDFESLDLAPGSGKTRVKVVSRVAIEFQGSRGGWLGTELPADDSTDGLEEWAQRTVETGWGPIPLETGLVDVPVAGEYDKGGRCCYRQVDPLPISLLSITREVEYGGVGG